MMFARPGRQQTEQETRRKAVKIEVATETRDAIINRIEAGVDEQDERGRQKLIGPSEIGTPCDFCLGAKLAGVEKKREFNWLAWLGTLVHAGLEKFFRPFKSQWLTEFKVTVGEIDGQEITGSLDLFDQDRSTVVDFKLKGDRPLDKARFSGEMDEEYRVQGHLYGHGLTKAGYKVRNIAVFYLPRNVWIKKPKELGSRGFWWAEEYDEGVATKALQRADRLARDIRELGADFVLPTLGKAEGCYDCPRWKWGGIA